jgi:hypothetical protein
LPLFRRTAWRKYELFPTRADKGSPCEFYIHPTRKAALGTLSTRLSKSIKAFR